jgi:uncharacterized damage-inducible protein DinB
MAESFEDYVGRIEGYVKGRDPMRILRETPRRLARRVTGASRRSLTTPPAPGKWSVGQILAHLSEIELLWGYRVRTMLERDDPEVVGMDQEVWARVGRYERRDPAQSLALYTALRKSHLDLLSALTPRELGRGGRHSQFGNLTIRRIVQLLAGHDVNHGRQIDAILKAGMGRGRR